MKQKRIKNHLRLGVFFLGFSVFLWNCVDERDFLGETISEHQHSEHQIRIIRGGEIPKSVIDFIDEASSGTKQVKHNKATGGVLFSKTLNRTSDAFGTVDETRAVIVPYGGEKRYSFLVEPNEKVDNEVINLIVVENEENSEEYFIKYQFDDSTEGRNLSLRSSNDMTTFSGTITYYDRDGTQTGQTTMSNGSTTNTTGDGIPCPPDDDDDNTNDNNNTNDDNNNNNGGGGPGGGNQPGDGTGPGGGDDNNGSGGGELVDPDNCSVISYSACYLPGGGRGGSDGHAPACQDGDCDTRCSGSATTITDWCTGNSVTFRTKNNDLVEIECENTVGIIFEKEDCEELNEQVTDSDFLEKMHELEEKLNLPHETGYAQEYTGGYNPMELVGDGSRLKFPASPTVKGIVHNHSGPVIKKDLITGKEEEYWPVNIYSPTDIESFLRTVSNGDGTNFDVSDAYSALVTFEGSYILKFKGDITNIPNAPDPNNKGVRRVYHEFVTKAENQLSGFMTFLSIYNVTNVAVYEINNLGVQTGRYYDENGDYKIINCI